MNNRDAESGNVRRHGAACRHENSEALSLQDIGTANRGWQVFALCEGGSQQWGRLSFLASYEVSQDGNLRTANPQTVDFRVRFWPRESRQYVFRLQVNGPDGQPLIKPVETETSLERRGEDQSPYNLIFELRELGIAGSGEYAFDLYLNDHFEGRVPLIVLPALDTFPPP